MFGVVTHSRLRSARSFPEMLRATHAVRDDLREARGLIRAANAICGPTEFFTLTTWVDRDAMYAFMRSGAHERVMWRWPEWLSSFWLCRMEPTANEVGAWRGARMGALQSTGGRPHATFVPPDFASRDPRARDLTRFGLTLTTTVIAPRKPSAWAATAAASRRMSRLEVGARPLLLARGVGLDGELVQVAIWRDRAPTGPSPAAIGRADRGGVRTWRMEWRPMDEFGTWDGMRVRRLVVERAR